MNNKRGRRAEQTLSLLLLVSFLFFFFCRALVYLSRLVVPAPSSQRFLKSSAPMRFLSPGGNGDNHAPNSVDWSLQRLFFPSTALHGPQRENADMKNSTEI